MSRLVSVQPSVRAVLSQERNHKRQTTVLVAESISFEQRRWPYYLALPVMWILTAWVTLKKTVYSWFGSKPRINSLWFDGLGLSCHTVKNGQASWIALNEIYNYRFGSRPGLGGKVDDFWEGMLNCQAVRNRLRLAKAEIREAIMQLYATGEEEIRLLSLAAGSAQGIIETLSELNYYGVNVRVMLVDVDESALNYAKHLAKIYGVVSRVEVKKTSVAQVARLSKQFKPHIIEMLGLMDYLTNEQAVRLSRRIWASLEPGGFFLTCNIARNIERFFLRQVVNWRMIYRTKKELLGIIDQAGFRSIRCVQEPLAIHNLVVARKVEE